MKSMCKPPLPKPPMRLPRPHSSNYLSLETPSGCLTKSQKPAISPNMRPENRTISCEMRALAKMVGEEFTNANSEKDAAGADSSVVFKRGRFYDEYSARRNERLMKKKGVSAVDEGKVVKSVYALGVTVESGKKSSVRKISSFRKSISAAYSPGVNEIPRYMLRSMSKENKKPIAGEKKKGIRPPRI